MKIDAIEPDGEECARQEKSTPENVHWHPVALGKVSGPATLHVLATKTGSSIYAPSRSLSEWLPRPKSYWRVDEERTINCLSLPDFLAEQDLSAPELLKLDVQGAELDILQSLEATEWDSLLSAEVEVEFIDIYEDQPLFGEIDNLMNANGFRLYHINQMQNLIGLARNNAHYLQTFFNRIPRSQSQVTPQFAADAVYLRDFRDPILRENAATFVKFILLLSMYGFHEFAIWFMHRTKDECPLNDNDWNALLEEAVAFARPPLPYERNDMIGKMVRFALKFCRIPV